MCVRDQMVLKDFDQSRAQLITVHNSALTISTFYYFKINTVLVLVS